MPTVDAQRAVGSRTAERREVLLDAALALLAEGGAAAVTHRGVAARAGLANGATTYHFATRDALLEAALRRLAAREIALVGVALTGARPEAPAQRLAAHLAERLGRDPAAALARYELFAEAARRPALRPALEEWRDAHVEALAPLLAEPRRAGELLDLLNGMLLAAVALGEQEGLDRRLEATVLSRIRR